VRLELSEPALDDLVGSSSRSITRSLQRDLWTNSLNVFARLKLSRVLVVSARA
jgi:hypothetical protein